MNIVALKIVSQIFRIDQKRCDRIFKSVWNWLPFDRRKKKRFRLLGLDGLEKFLAINELSIKRFGGTESNLLQFLQGQKKALREISRIIKSGDVLLESSRPAVYMWRLRKFLLWSLSPQSLSIVERLKKSSPTQFVRLDKKTLLHEVRLDRAQIQEIGRIQKNIQLILCELSTKTEARANTPSLPVPDVTNETHNEVQCLQAIMPINDNELSRYGNQSQKETSLKETEQIKTHISEIALPLDVHNTLEKDVQLLRKALLLDDVHINQVFELAFNKMNPESKQDTLANELDSLEKLLALNVASVKRLRPRSLAGPVTTCRCQALELLSQDHVLSDLNVGATLPEFNEKRLMVFINWSLSQRSYNVLKGSCLNTLSEFMGLEERSLLQLRNLGKTSVTEILNLQNLVRNLLGESPHPNGVRKTSQDLTDDHFVSDLTCNFLDPNDERSLFESFKNNLSVRSRNVLIGKKVLTIQDIIILHPKFMGRWRGLGKKSINEIITMRSHVIELIKAGYPKIDREMVSAENPLIPKENFDVLNPFEGLMRWLDRVVMGMKNPEEAKWVFGSRKGLLGGPRLTLEELAVKLGCTRERSRQKFLKIEERALRNARRQELEPLLNEIERLVRTSGGGLGLDHLTRKLLVRGQNGEMLSHALPFLKWLSTFPEWDELGLQIDPSGIVLSRDFGSLVDQLVDRIQQFSLEEADEFIDKDQWSVKVRALLVRIDQWYLQNPHYRKDLVKISVEMLDKILERLPSRLKRHGDKIYSFDLWLKRFAEIDLASAVAYFLKQSKEAMHFSDVTVYLKNNPNYANKWCLSETSVYAALEKSPQLLLWNRGTFIHRNYVHIAHVLLNKIETWVLSKLRDGVPFISAFGPYTEFKKDCLVEGMPNEIALYSLLRDLKHPLLDYPRLPYISLNSNNNGPVSIKKALDNFLLEARGPVKFEEIKSFALNRLFIKGYQLNSILAELNALRVDRKTFLHLNYLSLNLDRFKEISMHVQAILDQKDHVAAGRIFSQKKVTCKMAGIKSSVELYSLLKIYDHEKFDLSRYPMIRKKFNDGTTEVSANLRHEVAAYIRERCQPVSFSEVKDVFVKDRGYKPKYVETCIYTSSEIVKCMTGCVIHKDALGWNETKQQQLEELAHSCYLDATRAGVSHGSITSLLELSLRLPPLANGCLWTKFLASEMLTSRNRFIALGNACEAYMPIPNEHGIMNFTDMVSFVLERDFGSSANLDELTERLRNEGLIIKTFSKNMVDSSSKLVFSGKEIWLDEGSEYA